MAHKKVSAQSMDTQDQQADSSGSTNSEIESSQCNVTESCIDKLAIKEDTINYCRIILLMVDVGTKTLRYVFYQNIPKCEVRNYFASKITEIGKKKLFDKTQYNKLFCADPNPDEYDISLLIKLLLYFKLVSSSVDLKRLRDIRNDIVGHKSNAVLTKQDFENLWSEVKTILLSIAKNVSTDIEEDTKVEIEKLKHRVFEDLDLVIKIIKAFEAQNHEDIVKLSETVSRQQEDIATIHTDLSEIQRDVADLQRDKLNMCENNVSVCLEVKSSQHLAIPQDKLNGCRTEVINFYRLYEAHHPLSPWHDQYNAVLTKMYVNPPMCCIEYNDLKKNRETMPVKCYKDIFYKHSERCLNIFIKSLPGAGKTTLCKWMTLMWCQAHKPIAEYNTFFADEDLAIMKEFDFLFHVPLRNFTKTDHYIDDMIQKEILNSIDQREVNILQDILNTQKCLVVLDGLDEYAPLNPNLFRDRLPHLRKPRKLCVVITTRPWKFNDLQLKDYQVDQLLEITKFRDFETDTLISKVIRCLNEKSGQNRKLEDFRTELQKCMRQDIVSIPILLMQLVCLWYDNKPLGRSHCETYTNMLELLFRRSATEQFTVEHHQLDFQIPNCLSQEAEYCRNSMKLLHNLGHLAFDTLFNTCQESSLVFEASLARKYLSNEEMSKCLKIGILSQNKVTGLISSRCTVEFFHKTFQEFLSAFYISTCNDDEHFELLQLVIPSSCSVQRILETSEILIFLSGLCPSVVSKISINIGQIIHSNNHVRVHRESLIDYVLPLNEKMISLKDHQLKILGDLFINCVTESRANNCEIPDIPIKDLFYCGNEDSHYIASLQYLIDHCAHNVKSLCVHSESKTLQKLNLDNLNKLECLYVWFTDKYLVILPAEKTTVLTKSVPTLIQLGLKGASVDDKFIHVLRSCQYLQSVELVAVELTHKQMEELMLFLSQKTDLKEICLRSLNCIDHPANYDELHAAKSVYKNPDCSYTLNLTNHKLVHLKLVHMGFSDLSVNTHELQYCLLGGLSNVAVSTLLGDNSNLQNLSDLSCQYMWSSETIQCILTTVPTLVNLVYIFFCDVNIGNQKFVMSSKMKNLKRVALHRVSVNISTLHQLLNSLTLIKHKILVEVYNCELSPQDNTDIFKDEIRHSQRYIVCNDCVALNGDDLLYFYTNAYILPSPWQEEQDAILTDTIFHLNQENNLDKKTDECKMELKKLIRQDIVTIPNILKLLINLWYDNKPMGQSQCEMYANILELLFHRYVTLGQLTIGQVSVEQVKLPNCFSQNCVYCRMFVKLLHKLGHMAFDVLFNSHQERTLVFEESLAKKYLSWKELGKCFKIGILLKSKVTGQKHTFTFLHQTLQEFLSTLYIYMSHADEQLEFVREFNLEHMLKKSEILIFFSGVCPSLVSQIFRRKEISSNSQLTQKHRGSLRHHLMPLNYKTEFFNDHPLKVFQDLLVNCVTESRSNNCEIPDIPIEDVFYFNNEDSHYITSIQYLLDHSAHSVQSLCILSDKDALQKVNLKNLNNLECLYVHITDDPIVHLSEEMKIVWKTSMPRLKQFGLLSVIVEDVFVQALQQYQSLELFNVNLAHSLIEELMLFLSQTTGLKELSLGYIMCTDHKKFDCLDRLNLTYCQLEYLRLRNVFVSDINVKSHKLKYCHLLGVCHAAVSGVLGTPMLLPALEDLTCGFMQSDTCELIVTALSSLVNLCCINLIEMDIRDKQFVFTENKKLVQFSLFKVLVDISTLRELVNSLEHINGQIIVTLHNCKIYPPDDAGKFKQEIQERFYLIKDEVDDNGYDQFSFITLKKSALQKLLQHLASNPRKTVREDWPFALNSLH